MYLLDTNVVSELRKPRPHGAVVAWLNAVDDSSLYLATVTLGKIQAGIELTRKQDAEKAAEIEAWLDLMSDAYNLLPMDGPAFRCWTKFMHRCCLSTFYIFTLVKLTDASYSHIHKHHNCKLSIHMLYIRLVFRSTQHSCICSSDYSCSFFPLNSLPL